MANANQVIVNGETILDLRSDTVTPATLQKGYTAHDKSGMNITGTLEVPATEEQTVELSMFSGNQIIQPTSGKVMRKVTVQKPATLLSENIKKDVVIGGVAGTLEAGGTYYVELDGNFPNYTLSETTPLADIKAAYNDDKALFCRCSMDKYTATLPLFVPMAELNTWIFSGSGGAAKMNFPAQYFTIVVSAQGVAAEDKRLVPTDAIVTSVSALSTDREVPSAKCLYDLVGNITAQIDAM